MSTAKDDDNNALYLVMKGVVEITLPRGEPGSRDPIVDQFGSGQIFGDVALLANEARKTNAVALTNTTLMVLSREAIANVTFFHPSLRRGCSSIWPATSASWVTFIGRVKNPKGDLRRG